MKVSPYQSDVNWVLSSFHYQCPQPLPLGHSNVDELQSEFFVVDPANEGLIDA